MKKRISRHLGLAETSSVVVHDLSAQLHVMKFCLEELISSVDIPGGDDNDFVKQLRMKTEYVEKLLTRYRKLLKMTKDEDPKYNPYQALGYAKELIRTHYPSFSSKMKFIGWDEDEQGSLPMECIGDCAIPLHIIFSICSCFIECENEQEKQTTFSFINSVIQEEDKSLVFTIKMPFSSLDEESFLALVKSRTQQKRKLRQWCGLEYFNEMMVSTKDFYKFEDNEKYSSISFRILNDIG